MANTKTFLASLVTFFAFLDSSIALPSPAADLGPRAACTNPVLRKEWGAATLAERKSYTNAVLCLATKPSRIGLNSTLFDDFPWIHNQLNTHIHGVAQFLPWHRYFIHVYEKALKSCGYTGAAMYWDWVASSAAPASAAVWDPTTGFGGNGVASPDPLQRCITDGPFTSLRPVYYGDEINPHCITRAFAPPHPGPGGQEMIGDQYTPEVIAGVNKLPQYLTFRPALEGGPHAVVHGGISGDMGPLTSPNDPIFFLHHTQVDRLWWLWQQADPTNRLNDFAGMEAGQVPATLDDIMEMLGLDADRKVRDFMSTQTADLCYKY